MDSVFEKQVKELGEAIRKSIGGDPIVKANENFEDFFPAPLANFYAKLIYDATFARQLYRTIVMPGETFTIPSILQGARAYHQPTKGGTAQATTVETGKVVFTAKKLMSQISIPMESFEDFNPDNDDSLDQIITESFVNGMAEAEELAILMGDVDHTATAATEALATEANWFQFDPRLAFDGLLTIGIADGEVIDAEGASASPALIRDVFYKLGKYAKNKSNVNIVWNNFSATELLGDDDVRTVDKYAQNATIITGEIGKVHASTNVESTLLTEGYAIATVTNNALIGDRRKIKVKNEEVITTDSMNFVGSERLDFQVERAEAVVIIKNLNTPSAS